MYPYGLKENPFPSSPAAKMGTPSVLGGKRWKRARDRIRDCILEKMPVSVIVGPYGVGKTKVVSNLLEALEEEGFITVYVELSSGGNPIRRITDNLFKKFCGLRQEIVHRTLKDLDEDGTLRELLRTSFGGIKAWRELKKLRKYLEGGGGIKLRFKEINFLRNCLLTKLIAEDLDREVGKLILFSSLKLDDDMDSVKAMLVMANLISPLKKGVVLAFDELDILEWESNPFSITNSFRNLFNNLPENSHLVFAITDKAMYKLPVIDPGFHRRLTDKGKNHIVNLENPSNHEELFEVVRDIIEQGGRRIKKEIEEEELRECCKLIFDEILRKENRLSDCLTFFNTLLEIIKNEGRDCVQTGDVLKALSMPPEERLKKGWQAIPLAEKSKKLETAIRELCFKLAENKWIKGVHERGKRIYLPSGGQGVADVFFTNNQGKRICGEVKVVKEFVETSNFNIPEILKKGSCEKDRKEEVDGAIIWYMGKGLSDKVRSEIQRLKKMGKEVISVRLSEDEAIDIVGLKGGTSKEILREYGEKLKII